MTQAKVYADAAAAGTKPEAAPPVAETVVVAAAPVVAETAPAVAETVATPINLVAATERQWQIYAAINEWIRFADAKAVAVLTANGVLAAVAIGALKDNGPYLLSHPGVLVPAILGGIAALVSSLHCLACILPRTRNGARAADAERPLIFFEDIAGFRDAREYADHAAALGTDGRAFREISQQVWANAGVAKRKHRQIALSVWTLGMSLLCAAGVGIALAW